MIIQVMAMKHLQYLSSVIHCHQSSLRLASEQGHIMQLLELLLE